MIHGKTNGRHKLAFRTSKPDCHAAGFIGRGIKNYLTKHVHVFLEKSKHSVFPKILRTQYSLRFSSCFFNFHFTACFIPTLSMHGGVYEITSCVYNILQQLFFSILANSGGIFTSISKNNC